MGKFELGNELAILAGGRNPQWTRQSNYTGVAAFSGAPTLANSGVYLENSLVAMICVKMRRDAHRRTARVTIPNANLAATTYTVNINGTAHNVAPAFADRAAIIAALVSSINGGAQASVVTASAADEDSGVAGNDTLLIVGDVEADFTISVAVAGGDGTIAAKADPSVATLRVWSYPKGSEAAAYPNPDAWETPYGGTYTLDYRGFLERFPVAGVSRFYVELASVDTVGDGSEVTYQPEILIGPCITEGA